MSFKSLGLSEPIVRAITELGYAQPTPIQQQAIPAVLGGGDLLAGAQTGTGKTAGFTLPILQRLVQSGRTHAGSRAVRVLILTPTRELAAQVQESVAAYGKYLKLSSMTVFGGVSMVPQVKQLARGVDILVATPGRLLDHLQQKTLDLSHIEILVLDEADRMLDMGFIRDIRKILAVLPKHRQNLLFSATFSDEIKALADGLLKTPALIEVARRNATADTVAQKIHPVDRERKRELLEHLVSSNRWHQVLVFTRTKHGANRLAEQLNKSGITALAIHGNKSQGARTRALAEFKSGELQVLVATDIAARGIDIDQLPHVVNFDLPEVAEDYVHRIGRTGRAGASGEAISLVCVDEHALLTGIEKLIKRPLPREIIAGFEPDPDAEPQPIRKNARQSGARGRGGAGGEGTQRGQSGQTARTRASSAATKPPVPAGQSQARRKPQGGSASRPNKDAGAEQSSTSRRPDRPVPPAGKGANPARAGTVARSAHAAKLPVEQQRAAKPAKPASPLKPAAPRKPAGRPAPGALLSAKGKRG